MFPLRTMQHCDIEAGLRLCRAAGWNQTARDWELFLRLSPQGCRVALKGGHVIGTVATVQYENRFSWIGMVLVDPAERGQGVARLLMNEALDVLHEIPSIKLDATPAGHPVYHKLGFVDEYELSRMETVVSPDVLRQQGIAACPMTKEDFPAVAKFDRDVFGADRSVTLAWLLDGAPEYAWVVKDKHEITGYTFGRHGFVFEHLGPVIALDLLVARHLVIACLSKQSGRRFVLDATHQQPDWCSWLTSIGFAEQRTLTRMYYRGNPHPGLPSQQFGILGPEFG